MVYSSSPALLNKKRKYSMITKKDDLQIKFKRARRSTSSSSSNGVLIDNLQHAKPTASYIVLNDSHNKFDIDNIVIPYEMLINNNQSKIDVLLNKEITTPKWRVVAADAECEADDAEVEDLSDDGFMKRHEVHELKERYYTIFKKLEKEEKKKLKQQQQQQLINAQPLTPPPTIKSKLEDLCLDEFKILVNKLETEHKRKLNAIVPHNNQIITNNSSYLNTYLFGNTFDSFHTTLKRNSKKKNKSSFLKFYLFIFLF